MPKTNVKGFDDVEKAEPNEPEEEPDSLAALLASIKGKFSTGVAGPCYQRVFYYVCFGLAAGSFVASSVAIIQSAAEDTVTSVEVSLADEVPMPAMFGCMPASIGYPMFHPTPSWEALCPDNPWGGISFNTWGVGISMECSEWVAAYDTASTGGVEYHKGTQKDRAFLKEMLAYFQLVSGMHDWLCFMGNGDGRLKSERSKPMTVSLSMYTNMTNTSAEFQPLLFLGLFDPNIVGNLETILKLNRQIYMGNSVNHINTLKITYDKQIDQRGGVMAMMSDGSHTEEKITNLYTASMSTVPITYHNNLTASSKQRWSTLEWEVSTFISRTVTIRNKYLSEIWVQLGGAWASALLIVTFFFSEKVGGAKGKVQMFRFNTSSVKNKLVAAANRELGGMLQEQFAELSEVAEKAGEIKEKAGEIKEAVSNEVEEATSDVSQAIENALKMLQEENEKLMSEFKGQMEGEVAAQVQKILQSMQRGDQSHVPNLPGIPSESSAPSVVV